MRSQRSQVVVHASRLGCSLAVLLPVLLSLPAAPSDGALAGEDWEAMIASRRAVLASLPTYAAGPAGAASWSALASGTMADLLREDLSWFVEPDTGITGFRPYVKGTDQWGGADRTREITELMAMMDVLWPMARYLQLHPDPERQALLDQFIGELPKYYDPAAQQSTNRPGATRHDAWYFMENSVLKAGHLYRISGAAALEEPYLGSLGSALDMAHNFSYLFPQFIDLDKTRAFGYNTQNYSTAGLLAWSLVHAYQITGEARYLAEADHALVAMRAVTPPYLLIYEPQELAAAATAAALLTQYGDVLASTTDFAQLAQDFFYAQIQMMYYDGGQTDLPRLRPQPSEWLPATWRDGMFVPYYNPLEFGGINAPAFKENLESVVFWADYLRQMQGQPGFDPVEPLKVLNLHRTKNAFFFSPYIPDEWERDYGPDSLAYIPYEDIDYYDVRDHEDESVRLKAGYNGKEIYGAGEVLWAYLLYEALGTVADPNALIVNLNLFDATYPPAPAERVYLVFNPYDEARTLAVTLHHLDASHTVLADGMPIGTIRPGESLAIALPAHGAAYLTLD